MAGFLGDYGLWLLFGLFMFLMMRRGGCCSGHGSHGNHGSHGEVGTAANEVTGVMAAVAAMIHTPRKLMISLSKEVITCPAMVKQMNKRL